MELNNRWDEWAWEVERDKEKPDERSVCHILQGMRAGKRPSHHGSLSLGPLTLMSPVSLSEARGAGDNTHELTFLPQGQVSLPC